jgi:hypothetical protein
LDGELVFHSESYGWEFRLVCDGRFDYGRRFPLRSGALEEADYHHRRFLAEGWTAPATERLATCEVELRAVIDADEGHSRSRRFRHGAHYVLDQARDVVAMLWPSRRRMRSGRPFAKGTRLWQTNKMTQSGGTAPTAGEP